MQRTYVRGARSKTSRNETAQSNILLYKKSTQLSSRKDTIFATTHLRSLHNTITKHDRETADLCCQKINKNETKIKFENSL